MEKEKIGKKETASENSSIDEEIDEQSLKSRQRKVTNLGHSLLLVN